MNKSLFSIIVLLFMFTQITSVSAQSEGNIFHVQTLKFQMPEGGSWSEFDSLTAIATKKFTSKDDKIVSQRMMTHLWGSSNRQLIVITEYRNIEDAVGERTDDESVVAAAFSSKSERDAFDKAYDKYWRVEHGDEIYREISGGRK
jgi:hypothetical protein